MQIICHGHKHKDTVYFFICQECGCKFKTTKSETVIKDMPQIDAVVTGWQFYCDCPQCGKCACGNID